MNTLLTLYQHNCNEGSLSYDPAQAYVFTCLDDLNQRIMAEEKRRDGWFSFLYKKKCVKGLYLYGSVGAGKSYMMDAFFKSLAIHKKQRIHFHAFMKNMHHDLKIHQGEANPIKHIVTAMAKNISVLCFDEFVVSDIADAMILGRVFKALFEEGITVVTTSNSEPDKLYLKGLQRLSFLPTIALLKKHLTVVHCQSNQDYRLRQLTNAGTYHTPNDAAAHTLLDQAFDLMSSANALPVNHIQLSERPVPVIKVSEDCVWFDFTILCHTPRSQHDYLELVTRYKTVIVSNIPVMTAHQHNTILLFIRLIDILYDTKCRFICSAEKQAAELYPEGRFAFEYQRTSSRLLEMQSHAYVFQETAMKP